MHPRYLRSDDGQTEIVVTNYEMMQHFDPSRFTGIVLDESSILKSYDGKTRMAIIGAFGDTPYRLACTATPSPNDHMELGNHAEFLGYKSYQEMLAEYFVHDGKTTQQWRLKGHATDIFWRWVCSWAAVMSTPGDLGYEDAGYSLPPLNMHEHVIPVDHRAAWDSGTLFAMQAETLSEQRAVRRATADRRVDLASQIAAAADGPVVIWCELNTEGDALERAINGAVQIKGADSIDAKMDRLAGFSNGDFRVLVTKPSIAGFGLNWQHCATAIFVGASHSFEQTYQAIRRCWRFGQDREVHVHVIRAETEDAIIDNYRRKERAFRELQSEMIRYSHSATEVARWNEYRPQEPMEVPEWMR